MTYFQEGWDLYIGRFLMHSKTTDRTDHGDFVINESHYLEIIMLRSNDPESAFQHATSLTASFDDAHRNDKGQVVDLKCLGINDLDLLQTNMKSLDKELNDPHLGCYTLETIDLNQFAKNIEDLIPKKEDLSLFK